jgi:hypothetical protein
MDPRIGVEPFQSEGGPGSWRVRWRVTNLGARPVQLLAAMHPHAQFRTQEIPVPRELAAGAETDISLPVDFHEEAGTVVENPFLILRFTDDDGEWRALARVRVTAEAGGRPMAGPLVVVTTHRVGGIGSSA